MYVCEIDIERRSIECVAIAKINDGRGEISRSYCPYLVDGDVEGGKIIQSVH